MEVNRIRLEKDLHDKDYKRILQENQELISQRAKQQALMENIQATLQTTEKTQLNITSTLNGQIQTLHDDNVSLKKQLHEQQDLANKLQSDITLLTRQHMEQTTVQQQVYESRTFY